MNTNLQAGYGFTPDSSTFSAGNYNWGANFGSAKITKMEFNPNGGKEGAAQECIDVVINVGGRDMSYRLFPVNKVFYENNEIDASHPKYIDEFNAAMQEFNAKVVHLLKCFRPEAQIQAALSRPFTGFEEFARFACSALPADYATKSLDIFLGYQWSIKGDNTQTYLEIPTKMKYGPFLCAAVTPTGKWSEVLDDNGSLSYVDEAGNKHPFTRNKWYMNSNYAKPQEEKRANGRSNGAGYAPPVQNLPPGVAAGTAPVGSGWD
jgi:hypothetical protein